MTSDRPILERLIVPLISSIPNKNYIVPLAAGFYVTLNGLFSGSSRLALVYTAYSNIGNNIIILKIIANVFFYI